MKFLDRMLIDNKKVLVTRDCQGLGEAFAIALL